MKIMATSFKRSHSLTAALRAPNPAAGHHQPTPPPETPGHSQASLDQSLMGSLLLFPGSWCTEESVSPVLCKFWQLYGGVNGDLLQEGLWHTQVSCTQSPCPCGGHCWPGPPQETLRHSSVSVSVGHINDPILKTYVQLILIIHGFSVQIFLLAKAHLSPQVNTHVLLWSFTDIGSEELYFDIRVPGRD